MNKKIMIGAAAVGVIGYLVWTMRNNAQQQVNTTAANTSGSASAVLSGLLSGWANPSSVIPGSAVVKANGTVGTVPTQEQIQYVRNMEKQPFIDPPRPGATATGTSGAKTGVSGFAGVQNMTARTWNGPTTPSTSNIGANRDTAETRAARAANVTATREKMRNAGADNWVSGVA